VWRPLFSRAERIQFLLTERPDLREMYGRRGKVHHCHLEPSRGKCSRLLGDIIACTQHGSGSTFDLALNQWRVSDKHIE
jgi:hypothetical protein